MKISAIICTHNGDRYLEQAVRSLMNQSLPHGQYEIIIVDNCSTDNSKLIINKLRKETTNIQYIFESQLGLSHARNTGIENAKGNLIAFLDDDARACTNWLLRIIQSFETQSPRPVAVGGKIILDWEEPRPDWLPTAALRMLTNIDYSPVPRFLNFSKLEYPFGANMAFDREHLRILGGFDTNLGRIGKKLLSNEEKSLFLKIHEMGQKVFYDPDAYVYHMVRTNRISRKHLYNRQYWQGRSDVVWFYNHPLKVGERAKFRYYILQLISNYKKLHFEKLTPQQKVQYGFTVRYYFGCLVQELIMTLHGGGFVFAIKWWLMNGYKRKIKVKRFEHDTLTTEIVNKTQVSVNRIKINQKEFKQYFTRWQYNKHYQKHGMEKSLEHFVSLKLLNPGKNDTMIDIASINGIFPNIVQEMVGCKVYKQDVSYSPGINENMVGSTAVCLPFKDESIDFITLHCAFEHFEDDTDTRFIREAKRVLRRGGKVCILPLYLKSTYYILTDPNIDRAGVIFDSGAEIREQVGSRNRFGRIYNVDKFKERVLDHCDGLIPTMFLVNNVKEIDESCYLNYILILERK